LNIKPFDWPPGKLAQMSPLNKVKYLVIHHTASGDVSAETIHQWHLNRGWVGIGYHYVVRADGNIEQGRPDNKVGAHALNHNFHSLGIALAGNFTNDVPSPAQMDALEDLLTALRLKYPKVEIVKHKDLQPTDCPGDKFPWEDLLDRLQKPKPEGPANWKMDLVRKAKEAGLIEQDHNPDEPAPKWFVLAVALNLLEAVRDDKGKGT